jgi:hypothetical protein
MNKSGMALLLLCSACPRAQVLLRSSIQDDQGSPPPKSVVVLYRIPEAVEKAPPRSDRPPEYSAIRFDRQISIAAGLRDFSVPDLIDGRYKMCVYPEALGYLSNCEFARPADAYFDIAKSVSGSAAKQVPLTIRRGTIVEIVVNDPRGLIRETTGFHFRPGVMTSLGEFKPAALTGRSAGQVTYAVTIPFGVSVSLFLDTRLGVADETGTPMTKRMPSPITIAGGPARVQVRLSVAALDQDLSPRRTATN